MQKKKNLKREQQAKRFLPLIIILVIGILVIIIFTAKKDYEGFATCLTEKGFVMAGSETCSHCTTQKELFKGAFEDIIIPAGAYKDCERDEEWCSSNNIEYTPTWVTPEGNTIVGAQPLKTLAKISGCPLT